MLKSHQNLLEPRPSDRLKVGDRIVDIPLREIVPVDGGEPVRVTLKSLGVLLTLVAHAGKLVSREALMEWVWPDTMPTDDVLTQAITQLRKSLGDDRERPRYIETIAKQGYRLVAPVVWLEDEAAPAVPPTAADPVPRPARARWWYAAGGVAVVAALALGYRATHRAPAAAPASASASAAPATLAEAVPLPFQRIASQRALEATPSLSPDGRFVVYSHFPEGDMDAGAGLMLQASSATSPRVLTSAVKGQSDAMPMWAPDGRRIAFQRVSDGRCRVLWIAPEGGEVHPVGDCLASEAHPMSWYPDGQALVGARRAGQSSPTGGEMALYRMPLAAGRWERIPYSKSSTDMDMSPAVSPDGRWIAFHRNVSLADLWRIPVGGGEPQRLTHLRTNIYGVAWAPDGRHLVFARYRDGRIVLSSLALETGAVSDFSGGESDFMYPSISGTTGAVAFEVGHTRSIMRRVRIDDGDKAIAKARVLFDNSGSNETPALAPDGRQLLFASDRTGDQRMWWVDQGRPETLRSIEGFRPMPRYPASWSADARTALMIGRTGTEDQGVYEFEPRTGRLTRLPVAEGEPVFAAYHPDPDRLLVVADHGEGRLGAILYDRSRRPWRALTAVPDVATLKVDLRNRRILLASMSTPEIRSADLDLGGVRTVDRVQAQRRNRTITITEAGAMVMDTDGCPWHWRPVALGTERATVTGRCLGSNGSWLESLSYAPLERALYLSSVDEESKDVGIVPLSTLLGSKPQNDAAAAQPIDR